MRHAHFEHDRLVVVLDLQQSKRQSVFVVQISLSFQNAQPRAHKRRKDFLGGRLAHRTRHGADSASRFLRAPNLAGSRREAMQRGERVVHGESAALNLGGQAGPFFTGHHKGHRAAVQGPGQMIVSVVTRTVYRHKQFTAGHGSGVDRDADQFSIGTNASGGASGGRDTQGCSDLAGGPPHCVSSWLRFWSLSRIFTGTRLWCV